MWNLPYIAITLGGKTPAWLLDDRFGIQQEADMEGIHASVGIIAAALLIYLFVALLRPEIF